MATRFGYKVLSPGRWSCWVRGQGGGAVQYPVNKWARPRPHSGPLAVFETRADAESWIYMNMNLPPGSTIHPCHYRPSRFRTLWRIVRSDKIWKMRFPEGTRLANAVRTLE